MDQFGLLTLSKPTHTIHIAHWLLYSDVLRQIEKIIYLYSDRRDTMPNKNDRTLLTIRSLLFKVASAWRKSIHVYIWEANAHQFLLLYKSTADSVRKRVVHV